MSHFAKLDDNNFVLRVEYIENDMIKDESGNESEAVGVAHQKSVHGWESWKRCSYNTHEGVYYEMREGSYEVASDQSKAFRKNYPAIGDYYDPSLDAFIKRKPDGMNSWVLNTTKGMWEPPTPAPACDPEIYQGMEWDESQQRWEAEKISDSTMWWFNWDNTNQTIDGYTIPNGTWTAI